jgi:signal transduction histidine kinase
VDLVALTREVLGRHEHELVRAQTPASLTASLPVIVGEWDRLRVDQIVTNLVVNASKYGAGKPVEVELAADPSSATLTVRDRGIGIAPADLSRIFERFERAVSDRHFGGLGLGLWIARQAAEALGGSITVESTPGAGSTFVVRLPLRRVTSAE